MFLVSFILILNSILCLQTLTNSLYTLYFVLISPKKKYEFFLLKKFIEKRSNIIWF